VSRPGSRAERAFLVLAAAVVAAALLRLGGVVAGQLAWPYDIGTETAQLCSIRVLERGQPLYDPATYAADPFVLTMYTPLYHALVSWLPSAPGRPFLPGRLVAMGAMLAAAGTVFAVGRRRGRLAPAGLACGWFFLLWPALVHTAYLRSDSLALMLSAWAVVCVDRGGRRALVLGAVLAALAVAAKQSYVAAALACGAWLAFTDRKGARIFAAVFAGLLAAGAFAATLAWGRGFWFSVVVAPSVGAFSGLPSAVVDAVGQPAFVLLVVLSLWADALVLRRDGAAALRRSPFGLYALASLAVLLLTVGKAGANELYLLEFVLAHLLWLVSLNGREAPIFGHALAAAALALVAAVEVATPASRWESRAHGAGSREDRSAYYSAVRAGLAARGVTGGRILGLGAQQDALGVADDACLNDAFLYRMLWRRGLLDPQDLVDAVRRRAFDVVMLPGALPLPPPDSGPDAPDPLLVTLARAVSECYALAGRDGNHTWFIRP